MKNLYIVESPLQVLNAFEAIQTFPANLHTVLVRYSNFKENDKQINDTLEKLDIKSLATIKTVTIDGDKKKFSDFLFLFLFKVIYAFKTKSYSNVFLGNFTSKFMQFIIPLNEKIILMDDGAGSLNVQNEFTNSSFYNWFTLFDLTPIQNQKITLNTYSHLNKLIPIEINQNQDTVLFIGSKLSEAEITSEENYIHLVTQIAKRYENKKIIYVAHRGENKQKLDTLSELQNIQIKTLTYPIEMLSIYGDIAPCKIISFYSTALITLSKIYKVEAVAFKFDYSSSIHKKAIDDVYSYCSKYMQVIDVENI
jgi:hypothetical protein